MSFDFPNSPTNGQVFAPTGGPVYVYTGGVWKMQGSGQVVTAEARNRIVNGAMQVSQENGVTGGTTTNFFMADQWLQSFITTGVVAGQRYTGFTSPNGTTGRVLVQVNTADASLAAGEYLAIAQTVEGIRVADFRWGSASARQVVLRFGVRCTVAGTYGGAIRNAASNRSYPFSYTISAGEAGTDVYQTIVIPGDTTGTWPIDTSAAFTLWFAFAAGTGYALSPAGAWAANAGIAPTGISNGLATVSAQFHIFDVGLYLDPNATGTPPPWQMPDEAQELVACQRYWRWLAFAMDAYGQGGLPLIQPFDLAPEMRALPAISQGTPSISNVATFLIPVGNLRMFYAQVSFIASGRGYYYSANGAANARM